jgi:GTPase KRas protein
MSTPLRSSKCTVEQYTRAASGFLCVYSITSRQSFEEIYTDRERIRRVWEYAQADVDVPTVLVGNKCDLEDQREVTVDEGLALAKQFNCEHVEASAKEDINVERSFFTLVRAINQKKKEMMIKARDQQSHGLACALF